VNDDAFADALVAAWHEVSQPTKVRHAPHR